MASYCACGRKMRAGSQMPAGATQCYACRHPQQRLGLKRRSPTCQKCGQLWPGRKCRTCTAAAWAAAGKLISAVVSMPYKARCHDCGERYAQERGLCRQCARARGDGRSLRELGAAIVSRQTARLEVLERVVYLARPELTRVVDGVEYDVVWDGRIHPVAPEL